MTMIRLRQTLPALTAGPDLALAAALLFGISTPVAKLLLDGAAPQLVAGLLYLGSGVGLALVLRVRPVSRSEAPLSWRDAPWLAGAIAVGGVLGPLLLIVGLARTPAATTSLLLNLEGAFTALLAWTVFGENVDRRIALGMAAILAGGVAISWEARLAWHGELGPLAVAAACLCWGLDNNLTRRVSAGDPVQIGMLKGLVAGGVNTVSALALGAAVPPVSRTAALLLVGFLGYGVSLALFVLALRHLGAARASAYFSVAPFIGAAVSLLLFDQAPSAALVIGAALMAGGVALHLAERHEHEHEHEPTDHEHRHVHDEHHRHTHGPEDPPGEPHSHRHRHIGLVHSHPHRPDLHHRHRHR